MLDANILDLIFLNIAFSVTFMGVLINNFENHVPAFIIKGYRYGSFAYQGSGGNFLQVIEIPKSYYRHFYVFSSIFSFISLCYMIFVYFFNYTVHGYFHFVLRILLQQDEASVPALSALLAMILLTVQCTRRLYETYCVQVFAKTSMMNLSHYLIGLVHYFGCIIAVIGQAPLFCGNQNRDSIKWYNSATVYLSIPCILVFLWAWYEQYQTNLIFANLRRDKKTREVVTEDHRTPNGRYFNRISSPHRLCEIVMYTTLLVLVPTRTFFCIYLWVLCNQIQTAIQAHEWYKKTFKNYPKERNAICPYLL